MAFFFYFFFKKQHALGTLFQSIFFSIGKKTCETYLYKKKKLPVLRMAISKKSYNIGSLKEYKQSFTMHNPGALQTACAPCLWNIPIFPD